jgi:hypothetical protein
VIRIYTFGIPACSEDLIALRKEHVVELSENEAPGSHNRLIGRVDKTGKAARQVNMLIGCQGVPVLLEPDRDFI